MDDLTASRIYRGPTERLRFTGERFIPELDGQIAVEHMHRYLLAKTTAVGIEDARVLDVASGEGYGTSMLAEVSSFALGVDNSQEAVDHAKHRYVTPFSRVAYILAQAYALPLRSNYFDLAVSYETIEHLTEQDEMVSEISRVLKDTGILMMSTPNKHVTDFEPQNPFHSKELYLDEFKELIFRHFKYAVTLSQAIVFNGEKSIIDYFGREDAKFYIVVASNSPLEYVFPRTSYTKGGMLVE